MGSTPLQTISALVLPALGNTKPGQSPLYNNKNLYIVYKFIYKIIIYYIIKHHLE